MLTGSEAAESHVPVLLEETLESLQVRQGGVYLDGTVGRGGHALRLLQRYADTSVIGVDRDASALEAVHARLSEYGKRIMLVKSDFKDLDEVLEAAGINQVDGILLDLGVSSIQLEDPERGFSFTKNGPLDMRMDQGAGVTAAQIVNTWDQADLARLIYEYGEEKRSRAIASAIVRERDSSPVVTTLRLAGIVSAVPGMKKVRKIHPATRTFQALRIEVNDELDALEKAIPAAVRRLVHGGRVAIISFHSLEDRIVKKSFRTLADPCECPREFPECRCGKTSAGKVITKRPVVPSAKEIKANPRSRSAKLRVFERRVEGGK